MTDEIAKLQKRQREIEKLIATACGNMHASLHKEFQDNQKKLGKLMLERDKSERPEIYAEALAAAYVQEPVADGWVMVPRQMTTDMLGAYHHSKRVEKYLPAIWEAILAARPSPPCDGRAAALETVATMAAEYASNARGDECQAAMLHLAAAIRALKQEGKADE